METTVVDEQGKPLIVYHGTKERFEKFDRSKTVDGGFHFGTKEQAKMRTGPKGSLIAVHLEVRRPRRSKDMGGQWKSKIASAKSAGYDGIVYLNRYEGISSKTVLEAYDQHVVLDSLSDTEFRRFAPEARDSYIAFYPEQIYPVK